MTNETLKNWLGAMPIDDVRRKMERLEAKLSDLRVLERLHGDREPPHVEPEPAHVEPEPAHVEPEPAPGPAAAPPEQEGWGAQQG